MSSNSRSVRVRGERREVLDVKRFARAVLALHAQLQEQAKQDAERGDETKTDHTNATRGGSQPDVEEPEASP